MKIFFSFVLLTLISSFGVQYYTSHLNVSASEPEDTEKNLALELPQPLLTQTRFEEKFITQSTPIDYKTEYKDDPETEAGEESVIQEGKEGKTVKTIKVTLYHVDKADIQNFCEQEPTKCKAGKYDGEFDRDVVKTEVIAPTPKIISQGTKIVWKTLETPDGPIQYWKKCVCMQLIMTLTALAVMSGQQQACGKEKELLQLIQK